MSKTITAVELRSHQVDNSTVKAKATIAHGQKGGWVMLIDGIHQDGGTNAKWVNLGSGSALRGKTFEVSAVMTDVQAATNKLDLDVEISGPAKTTISIANTGNDGDSAAYSVVVFFQ